MLTDQLLAKLKPLIGFRVDELVTAEEANALPSDLKIATSGVTVDQCHDLLTLSTLLATFRGGLSDYPAYLSRTLDDAIRALLTTLSGRLAEAGLSPRVLLPTALLHKVNNPSTITTMPTGKRVGFMLSVLTDDVTLTIERASLQLTASKSIDFKFFEMSAESEGNAIPVAGNVGGYWQAVTIASLEPMKSYLLLYDPNDLEDAKPYNTFTRWPRPSGCHNCKGRCWSKYLRVESVEVDSSGYVSVTGGTNYGINLTVSAIGDVSPRLVLDPMRMLPALRQQVAMSFLEKIAYSTRKNPDTEDARQGALFALTDKENANRVPVLLDRTVASLVKSMSAEASAALDVDDSDDITWDSI